MIPPWMHLGESSELATARAQQLIHDGTLEVSEPAQIYPADSLPQRGDLAVVVDGSGRPVALAAALAVSISTNPSSSSPADGGDPDAGDTGEDAGKIVTETLRCLYPTGD